MTIVRTGLAGFVAGGMYLVASSAPSRATQRATDVPVAIVDVTVIPIITGGVLLRQTVVIRDGRIVAIGPRESIRPLATARVIDGRGKYVVPGLVDAHVHLEEDADLAQFVASGVTTVRDLMGSPETLAWRKRTADGTTIGPRIVAAGPLFAGPQVPWPTRPAPRCDVSTRRAMIS